MVNNVHCLLDAPTTQIPSPCKDVKQTLASEYLISEEIWPSITQSLHLFVLCSSLETSLNANSWSQVSENSKTRVLFLKRGLNWACIIRVWVKEPQKYTLLDFHFCFLLSLSIMYECNMDFPHQQQNLQWKSLLNKLEILCGFLCPNVIIQILYKLSGTALSAHKIMQNILSLSLHLDANRV